MYRLRSWFSKTVSQLSYCETSRSGASPHRSKFIFWVLIHPFKFTVFLAMGQQIFWENLAFRPWVTRSAWPWWRNMSLSLPWTFSVHGNRYIRNSSCPDQLLRLPDWKTTWTACPAITKGMVSGHSWLATICHHVWLSQHLPWEHITRKG